VSRNSGGSCQRQDWNVQVIGCEIWRPWYALSLAGAVAEGSVTVIVKGMAALPPAIGARLSLDRMSMVVLAREAAVLLAGVITVPPDFTSTSILEHRLLDAAGPQSEKVIENAVAGTLPVFLMLTVVTAEVPGTMVVLPPYLLMPMQMAELVAREPPSVLLHVVVFVPTVADSSMMREPMPAVLTVFWIEALKAENVGDIPRASTSDETPPARTSGRESLRFFEEVSDMSMVAPWLVRAVPLVPEIGMCKQVRIVSHRSPPGSVTLLDCQ